VRKPTVLTPRRRTYQRPQRQGRFALSGD